ncbi:hypothetical protein [Sphingomonas sp.]|uniref:hypothetical protein n=1 Tax=Sphingomonas sp. TaxID=28214 RepID=UPI00286BA119|nr:hypothetical protein [Sphingomonas sp.]
MTSFKLINDAQGCRVQAAGFSGVESRLLVKIAEALEEIASLQAARRRLEATRCW